MKLQTEVEIEPLKQKLNYRHSGLVVGSCFAENIGERLLRAKMNVTVNPFGVLYNPASIAQCVERLHADEMFTAHELIEHGGLWHSPLHHGSFSAPTPEQTIENINTMLESVRKESYDYIIITLGTAWVYRMGGCVVANCHKIPARRFERERLSVAACIESVERVMECYPDSQIILTVSPVRHIKDGLAENSLSKATLRVAAGELEQLHSRATYFPSFEIQNDQLRDYRFYGEDMCHPSAVAVEYIWSQFVANFIDAESCELIKSASKIASAIQHRPLHPDGTEYAKFREAMAQECRRMKERYKDVEWSQEIGFFS